MSVSEPLRSIIESTESLTDLGSPQEGPSLVAIAEAESKMGCMLSLGYVDFLKNYGSGYIFGDELFSIYGPDFENTPGGDLVYQYRWHLENNVLKKFQIPFLRTEQGEIFFFSSLSYKTDTPRIELPIYRKTSEIAELYSDTFTNFLLRYVQEGS